MITEGRFDLSRKTMSTPTSPSFATVHHYPTAWSIPNHSFVLNTLDYQFTTKEERSGQKVMPPKWRAARSSKQQRLEEVQPTTICFHNSMVPQHGHQIEHCKASSNFLALPGNLDRERVVTLDLEEAKLGGEGPVRGWASQQVLKKCRRRREVGEWVRGS